MKIIYTSSDFTKWRKLVSSSKTVGFVPTMGALHKGHLSLVESSIINADITVVSIFVNPKQFSKDEDFDIYPRNFEDDINKLKLYNVDVVFAPVADDIYKNNHSDIIFDHPFSKILEGSSRPHFFPGVVSVVSKLFNVVKPDFAHFGKKDAQQLLLMEQFVCQMNLPVKIVPGKTIREQGGLAMSSRNKYLTDEQKISAQVLFKSLNYSRILLDNGEVDANKIKTAIKQIIVFEKNIKVDYISIVDLDDLLEVDLIKGAVLVSLAVFVGSVRLIDNIFYHKCL